MFHASRRRWRLFYLAQFGLRSLCPLLALVPHGLGQTPGLTTISDIVYRADGSYASGVLLISWPPFATSGGATVAAGNKNITLGPNGSFTAQLAPNAGAMPAGTVYTVTYQLTDGTVKTESWSIGTTSPETISQVRTLAGATTPMAQTATQQYVNAQLATVVHLSGAETITGTKQFTVPPILPTPSQSGQAVNKAYVDSAVTNSGSGNFVQKAGDSMTGPLTLPADPVAPQQAADKHYVDLAAASKADLVSGRVPTAELGTGTANSGVCLHGDSTWGGCTGNEFTTNVQMDAGLTVAGSVQASTFISTGSGPWSLQGGFGTLSVAPSGQSLIGFGPNGKLQTSENGGALLEVAKLDTSGNIATAVALAQTPTQCTGSFATGIQANGNANCSTADQIQLAETTAPTGIPNYGIFWFDSTCHCPKVIDNNGQAVQLGLTNVFNQDSNGTNPSNTLEEVNGTSPQTLRVYRAWNNGTDWERTGLTWDQADGYFVLKNENTGADYPTQHGIGFWIGSNIRWAIDTASNFKPFVDNLYSVGSSTLRPATGYFGTAVYTPALLLQGSANSSGGPVNVTAQTAAIATTNLLTSATVGQYAVNIYLESDATCSSPGPAAVSVTVGWGDRTGARTMTVPLQGSGVTSGSVALGSTANFGEAAMTIWNNSASNNLTYSTTYTACTTGTGTYALYITYRRVQ
jgi:hypothetical protein